MSSPSERTPTGGLGRLVAAVAAFALVAPPALLALPLAALLAAARPRAKVEFVTLGVAAGIGGWWLFARGALPDQTLRAAAVFATVLFVTASLRTRLSVTHRALVAIGGAAAGLVTLFVALGSSWGALRWSVAHRTGLSARTLIGQLWASARPLGGGAAQPLVEFEAWLVTLVEVVSRYYPALLALELLAAFALATAIAQRVAARPIGRPLGRLRDFRFTEHLGWAAVLSLAVVVLPKLAAVKAAAANLLVVAAGLYALRGVAVAAFGLAFAGAGGLGLALGLGLLALLMLPVATAGSIVLGVLDSGLDFRRRWLTPPASK